MHRPLANSRAQKNAQLPVLFKPWWASQFPGQMAPIIVKKTRFTVFEGQRKKRTVLHRKTTEKRRFSPITLLLYETVRDCARLYETVRDCAKLCESPCVVLK
jgi:hypothetical protein